MPELPEVETIARGVDKRVRGDRIVEVWFSRHPQPFKTPRARQARELVGRTILSVHRAGKHIVCELSSSTAMLGAKKPSAHKADINEPYALKPDAHQKPDAQWI